MSKRKIAIIVLILTLAIFIALFAYYIIGVIKSRPVTVSEREQYQKELMLQEQEEAENK